MLAVYGTWGYGAAWPIMAVTFVGFFVIAWQAALRILEHATGKLASALMPNNKIEPLYVLLLVLIFLFFLVVPFQWALDTLFG